MVFGRVHALVAGLELEACRLQIGLDLLRGIVVAPGGCLLRRLLQVLDPAFELAVLVADALELIESRSDRIGGSSCGMVYAAMGRRLLTRFHIFISPSSLVSLPPG